MWIVVNSLLVFSLFVICKRLGNYPVMLVMIPMLLLQMYDLNERIDRIQQQYRGGKPYETMLQDEEFWQNAASKEIRHLVYGSEFGPGDNMIRYPLTDWALDNRMTVNDFYFARDLNVEQDQLEISNDTLYIFKNEDAQKCRDEGLNCYAADDLIIGAVDEISGFGKQLP